MIVFCTYHEIVIKSIHTVLTGPQCLLRIFTCKIVSIRFRLLNHDHHIQSGLLRWIIINQSFFEMTAMFMLAARHLKTGKKWWNTNLVLWRCFVLEIETLVSRRCQEKLHLNVVESHENHILPSIPVLPPLFCLFIATPSSSQLKKSLDII